MGASGGGRGVGHRVVTGTSLVVMTPNVRVLSDDDAASASWDVKRWHVVAPRRSTAGAHPGDEHATAE